MSSFAWRCQHSSGDIKSLGASPMCKSVEMRSPPISCCESKGSQCDAATHPSLLGTIAIATVGAQSLDLRSRSLKTKARSVLEISIFFAMSNPVPSGIIATLQTHESAPNGDGFLTQIDGSFVKT